LRFEPVIFAGDRSILLLRLVAVMKEGVEVGVLLVVVREE